MLRSAYVAAACSVAMTQLAVHAHAANPERMMQECRVRAHEIMHARMPDIATKYEGQRVDGTHAVNGTAQVLGRIETFQCSFERSGREMVQFLVNQPTEGSATQLPENEPSTRDERVRFPSGQTGVDYKEQLGGGSSVRYILNARNRQFLYVRVATDHPRTYFNIFTPDGNTRVESAKVASQYRGEYRGQLWLDGDHVVEVYNSGRRPAQYTITFELTNR
jgi:hypothetical protein